MKNYWYLFIQYHRFNLKKNRLTLLLVMALILFLITDLYKISNTNNLKYLLPVIAVYHFFAILFFKRQSYKYHPIKQLIFYPVNYLKYFFFSSLLNIIDYFSIVFLFIYSYWLYLFSQTAIIHVIGMVLFFFAICILSFIYYHTGNIIDYFIFTGYRNFLNKYYRIYILLSITVLLAISIYKPYFRDIFSVSLFYPFHYITYGFLQILKAPLSINTIGIILILFFLLCILFLIDYQLSLKDQDRSITTSNKEVKRTKRLWFYRINPWLFKDIIMLLRSPRFLQNLLIFCFWLILPWVKNSLEEVVMILLLSPIIVMSIIGANFFGYENKNITAWFLLPIKVHEIIRVKAFQFYILVYCDFLVYFRLLFKYPGEWPVILFFVGLTVFLNWLLFKISLSLSICSPKPVDYFKILFNFSASGLALLLVFFMLIITVYFGHFIFEYLFLKIDILYALSFILLLILIQCLFNKRINLFIEQLFKIRKYKFYEMIKQSF